MKKGYDMIKFEIATETIGVGEFNRLWHCHVFYISGVNKEQLGFLCLSVWVFAKTLLEIY